MGAKRSRPRTPAEWAELRRQVEAAGRAIDGPEDLSAEQKRGLLEDRARALAQPLAPEARDEPLEVLTFFFAGETYAIESRHVFEVFRPARLARIPGAEPSVVGVTAWRGDLLTLFDLNRMTGAPAATRSDIDYVIVLGDAAPAFGVLADAVGDVTPLAASAIHPPPAGVAARREFIRGITRETVLVLESGELIGTQR